MSDNSNDARAASPRKRLDSWKEIAEHLAKGLSQKTAQRYEKQAGLPVYREGVKVFAFGDELDAWKARRVVPPASASATAPAPTGADERRTLVPSWVLALAVVVTVGVFWGVWRLRELPRPVPPVPIGRMLSRVTSEDSHPIRFHLDYDPEQMAVSPDGRKLYVTCGWSRQLSVIDIETGAVRTVPLPQDGGQLAVSPDGQRLYTAFTSGVGIIDTQTEHFLSTVKTDGHAYSMGVTGDSRKLFLAMSRKGVWRMLTATGSLRQITDRQCPDYLNVNVREPRLYVTYQCSKPSGRDTLEVFDTDTEQSLGTLHGPPMIGGFTDPSPDGRLLLLDGSDACTRPDLHLLDCVSTPGHIFYLVRATDRQVLRTLTIPDPGPGRFLDSQHVMMAGRVLRVFDPAQDLEIEDWERPSGDFRLLALQSDRRKAYVRVFPQREILAVTASGPECLPMQEDLGAFYSADGVTTDVVARADLARTGGIRFAPGRVGQAFLLDGRSGYLHADWTGHYNFGERSSSLSLYVKFASTAGAMTIMDRTFSPTANLARLVKTADHHIRFDFAMKEGGASHVVSTTRVSVDRWYHITATKSDSELALFLDGVLEGTQPLKPELAGTGYAFAPLYLGATRDRQDFLDGKLDEIVFYSRALNVDDVRRLYQIGQNPACRM